MVRLDPGARRRPAGEQVLAALPARVGPRQPHRRGATGPGASRRPLPAARAHHPPPDPAHQGGSRRAKQLAHCRQPDPRAVRPDAALCRSRACGGLAGNRHAGDGARALHERGRRQAVDALGVDGARGWPPLRGRRDHGPAAADLLQVHGRPGAAADPRRDPRHPGGHRRGLPRAQCAGRQSDGRAAEAGLARRQRMDRLPHAPPEIRRPPALRDRFVPLVSGRCQRRHRTGAPTC